MAHLSLNSMQARFQRRATLRAVAWRFAHDGRGAAAVEFALVSGAFFMTLLFIMTMALVLYLGQCLDRATNVAARQIMIGNVQKANMSQSTFQASVLCPALPATMACSSVIVNVQTVSGTGPSSGYYNFVNSGQTGLLVPSSSATFSPGHQGDYIYVQVIYPITFLPTFMAKLLGAGGTFNGSPAYLLIGTAAFRNEQY